MVIIDVVRFHPCQLSEDPEGIRSPKTVHEIMYTYMRFFNEVSPDKFSFKKSWC